MGVLKLIDPGRRTGFADLKVDLLDYAGRVDELRSPGEVLDQLHAVTTRGLPLPVLAALRFPVKSGDWESVQLGKSAFLHKDVPEHWWEEYSALARGKFRPVLFLAASNFGPHTWTEVWRLLQPIGIDRWSHELALKHGIRDGFTCPVGGRWVLTFWSRKDLSNVLTRPIRIMIYAAASFAALRLEQLALPDPGILGSRVRLTPRELAVLRLVSMGAQFREVAQELGLGEETIRSHLKKA
jgi:LuxR family quorum sensing-dependent transcriptional regulator